MTIFQMKNGKVEPVAIIKAGKTTKVGLQKAPAAAAAPMAAPLPLAAARAPAPAMAPGSGQGRAQEVSAPQSTRTASFGAPFFVVDAEASGLPASSPTRTIPEHEEPRPRAERIAASDPAVRGAPWGEVAWTFSCSR